MTLYDTLGVTIDATPAQIKAAWRARASANHPDRGGSNDAMVLLNRAYEVLSDPDRRAHYDESGSDSQVESIAKQANDVLMQVLARAMQNDLNANIVDGAYRIMRESAPRIQSGIKDCKSKAERLRARRAQIVSQGEKNFVHMLIDQQLAELDQKVLEFQIADLVHTEALKLLAGYKDDLKDTGYGFRYVSK